MITNLPRLIASIILFEDFTLRCGSSRYGIITTSLFIISLSIFSVHSINFKVIFVLLIVVIFFVIYLDNFIQSVRIEFIDQLFENYLIKLFFTSFCILILINGSNFIDGVNTLTIGYYFLVLFFISLIFNDFETSSLNLDLLYILIFALGLLFIEIVLIFYMLSFQQLFLDSLHYK